MPDPQSRPLDPPVDGISASEVLAEQAEAEAEIARRRLTTLLLAEAGKTITRQIQLHSDMLTKTELEMTRARAAQEIAGSAKQRLDGLLRKLNPTETLAQLMSLKNGGWEVELHSESRSPTSVSLENWRAEVGGIEFMGKLSICASSANTSLTEMFIPRFCGGPVDPETGEVIVNTPSHFYAGDMYVPGRPLGICLGNAAIQFYDALQLGHIGVAASIFRGVMETPPTGEPRPYFGLATFKMLVRCHGFKSTGYQCTRVYSLQTYMSCPTCTSNGYTGIYDSAFEQNNSRRIPDRFRRGMESDPAVAPVELPEVPEEFAPIDSGITPEQARLQSTNGTDPRGSISLYGVIGTCGACGQQLLPRAHVWQRLNGRPSVQVTWSPRHGVAAYCASCAANTYHCEHPQCMRRFSILPSISWAPNAPTYRIICSPCTNIGLAEGIYRQCIFCRGAFGPLAALMPVTTSLLGDIAGDFAICSTACLQEMLWVIATPDNPGYNRWHLPPEALIETRRRMQALFVEVIAPATTTPEALQELGRIRAETRRVLEEEDAERDRQEEEAEEDGSDEG